MQKGVSFVQKWVQKGVDFTQKWVQKGVKRVIIIMNWGEKNEKKNI